VIWPGLEMEPVLERVLSPFSYDRRAENLTGSAAARVKDLRDGQCTPL